MKSKLLVLPLLALLALASPAITADHDHKKEAGPNGGRLITGLEPHAEFFVTAERKVQITFVDDDGKVVPPGEQVATVTTGDRSAPTTLKFTKSGDALISDAAIPAGNNHPTVVQIKPTASGKAVIEKFNLNLSTCPECKLAEYACTCDH